MAVVKSTEMALGPIIYHMQTQFGYAKLDNNGWLTHTMDIEEASTFMDFLNNGSPNQLYIKCMNGPYADWYLSASWLRGMGVWKNWFDASYWVWEPALCTLKLCCKSFTSSGNKMAYDLGNGYFYAYNGFNIADIKKVEVSLFAVLKDSVQSPMKYPLTTKCFQEFNATGDIKHKPYYMKAEHGYLTVDYKGYMSHTSSKGMAVIWQNVYSPDKPAEMQIMALNGEVTDAFLSTSENSQMVLSRSKETKVTWGWVKSGSSSQLTQVTGPQAKSKMGYNKDNGFYYADKHMPVVSLKIEYYDPITDEPKFLPK